METNAIIIIIGYQRLAMGGCHCFSSDSQSSQFDCVNDWWSCVGTAAIVSATLVNPLRVNRTTINDQQFTVRYGNASLELVNELYKSPAINTEERKNGVLADDLHSNPMAAANLTERALFFPSFFRSHQCDEFT